MSLSIEKRSFVLPVAVAGILLCTGIGAAVSAAYYPGVSDSDTKPKVQVTEPKKAKEERLVQEKKVEKQTPAIQTQQENPQQVEAPRQESPVTQPQPSPSEQNKAAIMARMDTFINSPEWRGGDTYPKTLQLRCMDRIIVSQLGSYDDLNAVSRLVDDVFVVGRQSAPGKVVRSAFGDPSCAAVQYITVKQ